MEMEIENRDPNFLSQTKKKCYFNLLLAFLAPPPFFSLLLFKKDIIKQGCNEDYIYIHMNIFLSTSFLNYFTIFRRGACM